MVERQGVTTRSIPDLIEILKNGGNTPEKRREVLELIKGGGLDEEVLGELTDLVVGGWRKSGEVPDSELETPPIFNK